MKVMEGKIFPAIFVEASPRALMNGIEIRMKFLEKIYFGNTLEAWLTALSITVASLLLFKLVQRFLIHRLDVLARRTATTIDDLLIAVLKRTQLLFLLIVGLYLGSLALSPSALQQRIMNTVFVIALLVQGAIWLTAGISFWLDVIIQKRKAKDASVATSLTALTFFVKTVLWSVALLLILENLGINVTTLVAGLGIGGIAIALALQNVLGDLFASLSIVLDKPFVIGDFVIVDEYMGTVEYIGLKTTRLRSLSGEQVIFSNADLLKSRIRNFKRMYERRVTFNVGVTYQTSYEKIAAISTMLRKVVESMPDTRFDRAHFKEYGDSALVFEVVYYVLKPDYNIYMDIQQAVNLEIFRQFNEQGIDFAYPTRTVHIHNNLDSGELREDQSKQARRRAGTSS